MTKAAELAKMGEVLTNSQIGGRRNMVINGSMICSQRGTSETGVGGSSGYFTVDRFHMAFAGSTAGRLTMSQESITDLSGFSKAIKLACTTADTSIAADEAGLIEQKFEGQDLQQLKKGTSDAEKVTVSFYVKGNAAATYTVELEDNDNSRFASQEFSVTTSWTKVTKTFVADTTGTLNNDNGLSLSLKFWFHGGSTYAGGTHTSNTWHTTTNARLSDNQTSFFDSTSRTFFITGLQMEVGEQATPFEHRSFGEELALCQRYYYDPNVGTSGTLDGNLILVEAFGTGCVGAFQFPVTMRSTPTVSIFGRKDTEAGKIRVTNTGAYVGGSAVATNIGPSGFGFVASLSGLSSDEVYDCTYKADAEL